MSVSRDAFREIAREAGRKRLADREKDGRARQTITVSFGEAEMDDESERASTGEAAGVGAVFGDDDEDEE